MKKKSFYEFLKFDFIIGNIKIKLSKLNMLSKTDGYDKPLWRIQDYLLTLIRLTPA